MELDLADRRTLLKSWLATLHGPELTVRPRLVGPLPSWGVLVRTAIGWHTAYALLAYAGALTIARRGASNAVAAALQRGGTPAVALCAVSLWWSGVALTSALWWIKVREARQLSRQLSRQ